MPPTIEAFHFSCPVLCGVPVSGQDAYRFEGQIRGTAFPIGGPFFLTAGHVAKSFSSPEGLAPLVGLFSPDRHFKCAQVLRTEILPGDLAILAVEFPSKDSEGWQPAIKWSPKRLIGLEKVRVIGYAYGLYETDDTKDIVARAFEGAVTARLSRFKLIGEQLAAFPVYELPFMAPRGLSGAPLLSADGAILVHGVVIGNSQSKMLVFSSEEVITEGAASTRVEQYESLTLGIATDGGFAQTLPSELLECTLGEHLARFGLMPQSGTHGA